MYAINHFIFLRVTDGENPVESVELTVSVNDVNEPPVFTEKTKTVEVHADQTPPQPVTTMAGTDVDSGDSITYAITSNVDQKSYPLVYYEQPLHKWYLLHVWQVT